MNHLASLHAAEPSASQFRRVSLLFSALYAKCPYYAVLYNTMQRCPYYLVLYTMQKFSCYGNVDAVLYIMQRCPYYVVLYNNTSTQSVLVILKVPLSCKVSLFCSA